jgi:hypothetical protein
MKERLMPAADADALTLAVFALESGSADDQTILAARNTLLALGVTPDGDWAPPP